MAVRAVHQPPTAWIGNYFSGSPRVVLVEPFWQDIEEKFSRAPKVLSEIIQPVVSLLAWPDVRAIAELLLGLSSG